MTNAQLDAALRLAEKERRRDRTQNGRGPVQLTKRQGSKRGYSRARDRQASRREAW